MDKKTAKIQKPRLPEMICGRKDTDTTLDYSIRYRMKVVETI